MYTVLKEKIRNVKVSEKERKTFYPGQALPSDYIPPKDYIKSGIVGEIKEKSKKNNGGLK
jgi:hypothetical protein